MRIRAIGYKADPHNDVKLAANQNASLDFDLQPGVVRWTDLNLYQGKELLPKTKGEDALIPELLRVPRVSNAHGFHHAR